MRKLLSLSFGLSYCTYNCLLVDVVCFGFILQLGYTKKQEERQFRGVITLEVPISC
jgi:hypothetical protein